MRVNPLSASALMPLVAIVLLGVDAGLLARGINRPAEAAAMFAWHGVLVVVSGLWLCHHTRRQSRYALTLWLAVAFCGPLGAAGVLLSMALERYHRRHALSVTEWHEMLFPTTIVDEQAELWRRIGQRASDRPQDQPVTPFLDVLAFGSVPQRQAVVAIIAQQFRPAFAPALKAALRDEHNVVRVQAATAIARLEQEFLERTFELEANVKAQPDDANAVLALAVHYDDQAFNGLLDLTREEECRDKATRGYEQFLAMRPGDEGAELRLARLQMRRARPAEAEPRFRQLVNAGHRGARLWLMESLFAQGRFTDLRALAEASATQQDESLTPEANATIDLWAGREVAS